MAKVKNPATFSGYFGVDPHTLKKLGVLDPTLAIDTKLFLDPLLFKESIHSEIHDAGVRQYRKHFETVIKFLAEIKYPGDVAWRTGERLLEFHEIKGTCLGYGAASISGSAFGRELTNRLLRVGKEIVDLGIRDPDLFPAMALFEAKIGSDRISDMATNVILEALVAFNHRVLKNIGLKGEAFDIGEVTGEFLRNPFQEGRIPIILVPQDILRKLPIARDWDDVADAASKNEALRSRVNRHIGHIWAAKTRRDKERLRAQALASGEAFQTLLDAIHRVPTRSYDVDRDPEGLIIWAQVGKRFAENFPLNLQAFKLIKNIDGLYGLVQEIVEQFQQLVEHNGLNKELYKEDRTPRHESTAQRLFFTVAYSYCKANDVDVSPEVDSGNGQVDFKFSKGFYARVLVEVKLSSNPKLIHGYEKQLEVYKKSETTMRAFYIVIDIGGMGKKDTQIIKIRNEASKFGAPLTEVVFVDGRLKKSASKR